MPLSFAPPMPLTAAAGSASPSTREESRTAGRRAFLGSCLLLAGAGMVRLTPVGVLARAPGTETAVVGDPLRHAVLAPLVGESFRVAGDGVGTQRLTLSSAVRLPCAPGMESFLLIFEAEAAAWLPEAAHRFSHPATGGFDLFVIPVTNVATPRYRAVIHRFC